MLADLEDGTIGGVPDLGVYWQKIENDALREHLALSPADTGVRVSRVVWGSSAHGALDIDDVIVAIDGVAVACDGTVPLREAERVRFEHLIACRQVGETVRVEVLRRGARQRFDIVLARYVSLVPPPRPDRRPTYFIVAGLLFTPLSYEYMAEWEWAGEHHRYQNFKREVLPSQRRKQVVILHEILAHDVNLGYHQMSYSIVERINDIDITEMRDVVRAFASPLGKIHVIETDLHGPREANDSEYHWSYGTRIVLEASRCERATAEILAQHGIPSDRSDDLR
jgi:hypothetical protein